MKITKILCGGMLAVLAFTACESNNDNAVADGGSYLQHVTLQASMGGADTRALSEGEGNVITATFAAGDQVVVVDDDGSTIVGTLTAATAGANTTLSGELNTKTLTAGETVTLHYRSATANYDDQVGTLDGIATGQDYATGTLTVSSLDPLTFGSNSVTLAARQSITKFSFTSGGSPVSVKTFGIAAEDLVQSIATNGTETEGAVTGTLTTALSDVYVALRNNSDAKQTYSFTIKDDGGNWYTGTKIANLVNGKNYTATVTLTKLDGLTAFSAVGTVGVVGGLPAIVVESKKAVALMNAGALCPEDFGGYYTFAALSGLGLPDGWYVPTETELNDLVKISSAWTTTTHNGVKGRLWTIGGNFLFLPAAGYYDNDTGNDTDPLRLLFELSLGGYYWSASTDALNEALAYRLYFSNSYAPAVLTDYKVNELNVRPFHALN